MNTSPEATITYSVASGRAVNAANWFSQAALSTYSCGRYTEATAILALLLQSHLRELVAFAFKQNQEALNWLRS